MEPRSHLFDVEDAKKYGVNAAVFLEHLRFWVHKNIANKSKKHYRDGRWWTYNSARALTKIFPYWTARQIRRIIKSLEEDGVIITAHFGGGDRRTWYAFGAKNAFDQTVKCPDTHVTKRSNGAFDQTVTPCDQTVKCIKGAVDNPVELPIKGNSSKKGLKGLSGKAPDKVAQRADCSLLRRYGVEASVADAIVYQQGTSSADICQAVENAVAKEWEDRKAGGTWTAEPGYIVSTINAAFTEEHPVRPSPASRRMKRDLKPKTIHRTQPLTRREFDRKRKKNKAAMLAMQ